MRALGERLGLPRMGTARPFALAMVIDAVGSGLLLPFSLLYFHYAGGLSLAEAGLGLTVSMLIAVPAPLVGGVPVDHVGPRTVAVATNAARVVGFLGYLLVHDLIALVMVALLVSVSDRLFWVAQPALIGEFAASGSRDRWFGLAITRLLWPAAVSFALAAVLITSLRVPERTAVAALPAEPSLKGYRAVLADRPFCWIVASNVVFGIVRTMIGWLPGLRHTGARCARVARRNGVRPLHLAARGRANQLGSPS